MFLADHCAIFIILLCCGSFQILVMMTSYQPFGTARNTRRRNMCLDELGQTFVVRMVMRLNYEDGHKTH